MRDPLQEPRFGDVFEFQGDGITYRVLYLSGPSRPRFMKDDDWTGLTLDEGYGPPCGTGEVEKFLSLNSGPWRTGWRSIEPAEGDLLSINLLLDNLINKAISGIADDLVVKAKAMKPRRTR